MARPEDVPYAYVFSKQEKKSDQRENSTERVGGSKVESYAERATINSSKVRAFLIVMGTFDMG